MCNFLEIQIYKIYLNKLFGYYYFSFKLTRVLKNKYNIFKKFIDKT